MDNKQFGFNNFRSKIKLLSPILNWAQLSNKQIFALIFCLIIFVLRQLWISLKFIQRNWP